MTIPTSVAPIVSPGPLILLWLIESHQEESGESGLFPTQENLRRCRPTYLSFPR